MNRGPMGGRGKIGPSQYQKLDKKVTGKIIKRLCKYINQMQSVNVIIPVRGYRESGGVETVDPALWKL